MDSKTYDRILALLKREVKPALGCTEPIAVAIAVARAAAEWPGIPAKRIEVRVSPNILKNAMGVGIPGTGLTGLPVAAALALVCGRHEYGLEVLKDADESAVSAAKRLVSEGRIGVSVAHNESLLYAEAECFFPEGHTSLAAIRDSHDSIVKVVRDGKVLLDVPPAEEGGKQDDGRFLTLELINEFASCAPLRDLELMRQQVRLNSALASAGMSSRYGLSVGLTLAVDDAFGDDLSTICMSMTAAASDARMSGCMLPAMSNSGSGNQGITVSMPVIATARRLHSSQEALLRALALSNLVAIHIKSYLGRLSALCGCVVASTGASCGIVRLKGGTVEQMGYAIKNMIGSITGMVCDGAKEGCAMKVASGVSCALQSAILARRGICVRSTDGIIDDDVEKTIRNLGEIGAHGMHQTDEMILNIMICK